MVVFAVGREFGKGEYEMHGVYNLAKIRGGEAARNEGAGSNGPDGIESGVG